VLGRRRRRLRRTAWAAIAVAAATVGGLALYYRATHPETRRPGEALPEITSRLSRGLPPNAPAPHFTDVTAAAGLGDFVAFRGERSSQLPEDMGTGAAWGDWDGDGDDDLFLVSAGGPLGVPEAELAPSLLYENRGNGSFRPAAGFPDTRIHGMAAAWGDYDGDGRLDLAVSGFDTLRLYRNDGASLVADGALTAPPGFWAGLAWGDFDNDRDLDLYVCGYVRYAPDLAAGARVTLQYGSAVPFTLNPASFEPERNLLYRNDGGGGFTEVAEELGVANPAGRSLGALWHDFDGDGWLDLYVANDISDNALYLNRRGRGFADAGLAAWVADYRGAMGLAAGDWNRDGDDDLFVTHWVAQENALFDSLAAGPMGDDAAEGAGGTATAGEPPPLRFTDVAAPHGLGQIALPMVGWGTAFADFDSDGWLDLAVANGSTFETADAPKRLVPQPPFLFWNQHGHHFHDLAPASPPLAEPMVGRGLAVADYDRDGDLDLLFVRLDGGARLLRNDIEQGNRLSLRLRSRTAAGEALGRGDGATVIARAGGAVLRRTVTSASYLSQDSATVHLGLGAAAGVDSLEVRWLGGAAQTFPALAGNAVWELAEGDPVPRRSDGAAPGDERARRAEFWETQRAAMDALKVDGDAEAAERLLRRALEIDPDHEDARYYLANSLASQGRLDAALDQLDVLRRSHPGSHRAHKQWGVLRARSATTAADLDAAATALERALELNLEETGALLALAEIDLIRGRDREADRRLEWVIRTHPRSVGGLFLRGYLAYRRGDAAASRSFLAAARSARGEERLPAGAVAEGEVRRRMHEEQTPLSEFWQRWDGEPEPERAYAPLRTRLAAGAPAVR
jgi:tetratricopeptide (TPR) repeat protein